jgi:hypothetical protein
LPDPETLEQVWTVALAGEAHVPGNGEVREQPVILREVTDAASLGAAVDAPFCVEPDFGSKRDPSCVGAFQASDSS